MRLDQDRRAKTAVPHVARPQTLAERHLLIVGALPAGTACRCPQKTAQSSTLVPHLLGKRLVHLQEGNDLGHLETARVRMLRRESAVGQGENGCPTLPPTLSSAHTEKKFTMDADMAVVADLYESFFNGRRWQLHQVGLLGLGLDGQGDPRPRRFLAVLGKVEKVVFVWQRSQ